MPTITLSAGPDLVQRLAVESDPVRAVIELVWNSLDADADHVAVSFERNEADGIIAVTVKDDGNGMSPERIDQDFRWVGNSWKRAAPTSENKGRPMHGRFKQSAAFQAACDLVFKGVAQPSGYTEPLLHAWRQKVKAGA